MTAKSILEIDVQSQSFQRYVAQFDKYRASAKAMPKYWSEAAKTQQAMGAGFARHAATMQKMNEVYRSQTHYLTQADRLWTSMSKTAAGIATSILSATRSLISWSGVVGTVGGLIGAGSLLGIDRMARNVSNERSTAMGLGMSIGQKKAFDITFGSRGINSEAFLGWMAQMETDSSKLTGLPVSMTKNVSNDAVSMLRAVRAQALANPAIMGMLPKMWNLEGLSSENVRQLAGMSDREFEGLAGDIPRLAGKLDIGNRTAERWQDFLKRVDEAKEAIFKTFVEGLKPLADPLMRLSGAFEGFLQRLLNSKLATDAVEGLAHWLETFSGKISRPAFLESVDQFTETVRRIAEDASDLADVLHRTVHPWDNLKDLGSNAMKWAAPSPDDLKAHPGLFQSYLARQDWRHGLGAGTLELIKGLEHSDANAVSPKGAQGLFQLMPDTFRQYAMPGDTNPFDPVQSTNAAGNFLEHLRKRFGGDITDMLAAYNWGERNVETSLAGPFMYKGKMRPQGWMPDETRQYLMNAMPVGAANGIRIDLHLHTPPGSDLTAAATALAR